MPCPCDPRGIGIANTNDKNKEEFGYAFETIEEACVVSIDQLINVLASWTSLRLIEEELELHSKMKFVDRCYGSNIICKWFICLSAKIICKWLSLVDANACLQAYPFPCKCKVCVERDSDMIKCLAAKPANACFFNLANATLVKAFICN
ncbi:hypothetical protein Tco_0803259 [Tanacetum coccineum]|uniref:Uncharacterized protein n=1 Tax=Tanacetum coccineum TaxID=301880 RepID=A0ABQ5A3V0_9ASTR